MGEYYEHGKRTYVPQHSPFGDWLSARLEEKGWNRSDLERAAGLSNSYPNMIINGYAHPSPIMARKIADAMGLDYDELWGVAQASRTEWGRRRKSGQLPDKFSMQGSFRTTAANMQYLKERARRENASFSKTCDRIVLRARLAEAKANAQKVAA